MSQLERQLDAVWDEARKKKVMRIESMNRDVTKKVDVELNKMHAAVSDSVDTTRGLVNQKLDRIHELEAKLASSTEVWRAHAAQAARDLEVQQQGLKGLVTATVQRCAQRRADMEERQRTRTRDAERAIRDILQRFHTE